jgi:uncharacterized OB-fold protein
MRGPVSDSALRTNPGLRTVLAGTHRTPDRRAVLAIAGPLRLLSPNAGPRHSGDDLEWREIDGAGSLYTFTVADRPTGPPWADALPQYLAVVEWDAGPRISTELVDVARSDIRIGIRVAPVFVDVPDTGVTLLRYRPA